MMVDVHGLLSKVVEGFRSLRGSPVEIWKAYALKFLDSYSYFSFSVIFTLFLSDEFGYSDIEAGSIYGTWGALVTVFGLATGVIVDNIGVASSLRVGFLISLISRCLIFATTSRAVLLMNVCFLLPLGNCLGIPVIATGIRRYTNEANRGFAFGLFYVIMNVGALLSGRLVDICTIFYNDKKISSSSTSEGSWSLTSYRFVILTGIATNVIGCVIAFTMREIKVDVTARHRSSPPSSSAYNKGNIYEEKLEEKKEKVASATAKVSNFEPIRGNARDILRETMQSRNFRRFLAVCLITVNVKMIFRHLDATLPKYMVREFGKDTPKGTVYSINPALIIILVPLVQAATTNMDPLVMIHYGMYISALSPFFLVFSTSVWACVMFVIVLSVGEAVWSPRLYDYTMKVAKEGREGTYSAMSSAPLFLAKLPVGFMSGFLLEKYCPEEGPRQSNMMWLIIALTTCISPILMTVCWKYVSGTSEDGDEQYTELMAVDENLTGSKTDEVDHCEEKL